MSLYTSVYWTKRVIVVLSLIVFICGGIRLFQFVGTALTKTDLQVSGYKPENGFGKIDRISFEPIISDGFSPTEFRISTTKGNLDADNLYPLESETSPLSNVYRIIEQPIDLSTTQEPVAIGKSLNFTQTPQIINSTQRKWVEGNRQLQIDGQYKLVSYSNQNLKKQRQSIPGAYSVTDQSSLQNAFGRILTDLGIKTTLIDYTFSAEYLDYDLTKSIFIPSQTQSSGGYIRVNAKRIYPNLVKIETNSSSRGVYPSYSVSNNYFILPNTGKTEFVSATDLVELSVYNWSLNQSITAENPNVQTYSIKTPRTAYTELSNNKGYLVSLNESFSKKPADISAIKDVKLIEILSIRIDMYESKEYKRHIQPIYVFSCEAISSGVKYQLIYYVPAIIDSNFNN